MRHYRIKLNGDGGEIVIGQLTNKQISFWRQNNDFYDYMSCREKYNEIIPAETIIENEWRDIDQIAHESGVQKKYAMIEIIEVNSNEYEAKHIRRILKMSLGRFLATVGKYTNIEIHSDINMSSGGTFYGMSLERGTFYDALVIIEDNEFFDYSLMKLIINNYPTGDEIITQVLYNDCECINFGGNTKIIDHVYKII